MTTKHITKAFLALFAMLLLLAGCGGNKPAAVAKVAGPGDVAKTAAVAIMANDMDKVIKLTAIQQDKYQALSKAEKDQAVSSLRFMLSPMIQTAALHGGLDSADVAGDIKYQRQTGTQQKGYRKFLYTSILLKRMSKMAILPLCLSSITSRIRLKKLLLTVSTKAGANGIFT